MRSCGTCTACCSFARVPELGKAERVACRHCAAGCTIYADRPGSCRAFECAWLAGQMHDDDRPDKSGVMVEDHGGFIFAMCAGNEWRAMSALDDYVRAGRPVVIGSACGNAMLLPEGMGPQHVIAMVQGVLDGRG